MNQENATLQSADPKPPTRDKIRWFWFAFDIILILFIIAFIEFLIFALPLEGYYFGLSQGKIGNGTTLFATSLLLSPVALIAFLILIVRMFTFWPRHIKHRKNRIILQALTICVLIASIAFPSALVVPFQKNFTDGFQEHVQMADIEAIQQWVGAIDKMAMAKITVFGSDNG